MIDHYQCIKAIHHAWGCMLPLHGFFLEEYLTFTHHHGKTSLLTPPYRVIIHYSSVYRVYLPFYRVKNPISPSLPYVFRLTPSYPTPTIAWPLPRRYHCSMNIGAGDPTRPIPPSLDVLIDNDYSFIDCILGFLYLCYHMFYICFLTRGFVRPQ